MVWYGLFLNNSKNHEIGKDKSCSKSYFAHVYIMAWHYGIWFGLVWFVSDQYRQKIIQTLTGVLYLNFDLPALFHSNPILLLFSGTLVWKHPLDDTNYTK